MTLNQNSPLVLHPKSKKIKKTKNQNPLGNDKKSMSRSYQSIDDSLKKYILIELKKGLLNLCKLQSDEEEWNEEQYFQLLNSVDLKDYNDLLENILLKHVQKLS